MEGVGDEGKEPGLRHFVEADVEAYGACHEEVVVVSGDGAEGSVWFSFVVEVFVECAGVAFDVEVFAYGFDEGCYYHWFCGGVCVETVFTREALADVFFGLAACIEVRVNVFDLIEDK